MTAAWRAIISDLAVTSDAGCARLHHEFIACDPAESGAEERRLAQNELNVLHALVMDGHITAVLQVGCDEPFATLAMASALQMDVAGRLLVVCAPDISVARPLCRRYDLDAFVEFAQGSINDFVASYQGAPFDLVYLDRDEESEAVCRALADRQLLKSGAQLVFSAYPAQGYRQDETPEADAILAESAYCGSRIRVKKLANSHGEKEVLPIASSPRSHAVPDCTAIDKRGDANRDLVFRHSGERGDIVFSLPAVRSMGGGTFLIDPHSTAGGKTPLGEEGARALLPLLESQPYIRAARLYDDESIDIDLDAFRSVGPSLCWEHLVYSHCRGAGLDLDAVDLTTPWLSVAPLPVAEIIVCRAGRREGSLNWPLLREVESRCLFVGTWMEYQSFCDRFDISMPFYHARNYLDLAAVVAGAQLVVADQTFVFALAEGLKKPRVLEVFLPTPNGLPLSSNGFTELTPDVIAQYCGH